MSKSHVHHISGVGLLDVSAVGEPTSDSAVENPPATTTPRTKWFTPRGKHVHHEHSGLHDTEAELITEHVQSTNFRQAFIRIPTAPYVLLNHGHAASTVFEFLITVLILYTAVEAPFEAAFSSLLMFPEGAYEFMSIFPACMFLLDFLRNFITTYADEEGDTVIDPSRIVRKYVFSVLMPIDVAAAIPFDLVNIGTDRGKYAHYLHLARLVRITKLVRELDWVTRAGIFRLIMLIGSVFMIIHWGACGWFAVGKQWMCAGDYQLQNCDSDRPDGLAILQLYMICVYQTSLNVFHTGIAVNPGEQLYFVLLSVLGAVIQATVFGSIAVLLSSIDEDELHFHRFKEKLLTRMTTLQIPGHIKHKVLEYQEKLWKSEHMLDQTIDSLFYHLPRSLHSEIKRFQCRDLLHDAHLFDSVDPIVIEELVMKLQSRTFLAGDMIIRQGERSEWMGLVLKGKLAVMQNKKVLRVLSPGSHVGEVGLIFNVRRTQNVQTLTWTHLMVLTAESWATLKDKFSEELSCMENKMKDFMKANKYVLSEHDKAQFLSTSRTSALRYFMIDCKPTRPNNWADMSNSEVRTPRSTHRSSSDILSLTQPDEFIRSSALEELDESKECNMSLERALDSTRSQVIQPLSPQARSLPPDDDEARSMR